MSDGDDAHGSRPSQRISALPAAAKIPADQTIRIEGDAAALFRKSPRKGSLLVIAGAPADIGTHILVDDTVIIGRDAAGLVLRDGRISRAHARVDRQGSDYMLHDLGSTNGTLINGTQVKESPLGDGDRIFIGQTILKFTLVDETEARYLRRIERLAGVDDLTGLLAKHRFDSLLDETIRNARATGVPLSALMMDMDGLKQINDRHGHRMGANTIAKVGALIREILAGLGEAARFGGDEFCAYLPGMTLESAMRVGARIRREVEAAEFTLEGVSVKATISIGVATLDEEIPSGGHLLARADKGLYRAKAIGRNAVSD